MFILVSFYFFLFEIQIKIVFKRYSLYCNNHYDFSGNNTLSNSNIKPFTNEIKINDDL